MTEQPPKTPGQTLRDLLDEQNISQSKAALSLGISRGYLNTIINGHNPISAEIKLKLAEKLNIPTSFWRSATEKYENYAATPEGQSQIHASLREELFETLRLQSTDKLSGSMIKQAVDTQWLKISPFNEEQLTPSGYWLTLGNYGLKRRLKSADEQEEDDVELKPACTLRPGDLLDVLSLEQIQLPPSLDMIVTTPGDDFCKADLVLYCRKHFPTGLDSAVGLQILNQSGRPHLIRSGQMAIHVQFVIRLSEL